MDIYSWHGPEMTLVHMCTVNSFSIEKLNDDKGEKFASGRITIMDYVKGCEGTDPWQAVGIPNNSGSFNWVVKRSPPKDGEFAWKPNNGEYCFTLIEDINEAMRKFIADMTGMYVAGTQPESQAKEYNGEIHEYSGPCLCEGFRQKTHFDWLETTNGKYPNRCFKCSCGNTWWCYDPDKNFWGLVKDPEAWDMLVTYNGVAVRHIELFEDGLYLLVNIRKAGYIPISYK